MKITKSQLKQIIKEELQNVFLERAPLVPSDVPGEVGVPHQPFQKKNPAAASNTLRMLFSGKFPEIPLVSFHLNDDTTKRMVKAAITSQYVHPYQPGSGNLEEDAQSSALAPARATVGGAQKISDRLTGKNQPSGPRHPNKRALMRDFQLLMMRGNWMPLAKILARAGLSMGNPGKFIDDITDAMINSPQLANMPD